MGEPHGNWGAWESTGIVDASAAFGRGVFLINVQAHTLWVEKAAGDDNNGDAGPDFTYKREGGQLLLIRIPWAYRRRYTSLDVGHMCYRVPT